MALYLPTTCAIFEPCANTESFTGPPPKVGLGGYSPPPSQFFAKQKTNDAIKNENEYKSSFYQVLFFPASN